MSFTVVSYPQAMDYVLLHVVVAGQEFETAKHLMCDVASVGGAHLFAVWA